MLSCYTCHAENPNENTFCQHCGASLRTWRAIVAPKGIASDAVPVIEGDEPGNDMVVVSAGDAQTAVTATGTRSPVIYLDSQERYRLQTCLNFGLTQLKEYEAVTLDCDPLTPSSIAHLREQWITSQKSPAGKDPDDLLAALPFQARPYFLLQDRLFPVIPYLHDAWEDNRGAVLVLEDRSAMTGLFYCWHDAAHASLQQLHWLYEMAELWEALEPWQGHPSLLNLENLRIDEDQILCLRRLYFQSGAHCYTLRDLGLLWQALLQQSTHEWTTELIGLCQKLVIGELKTVRSVRHVIAAIADRLQEQEALPQAIPSSSAPAAVLAEDSMNQFGEESAQEPQESAVTANGERYSADFELEEGLDDDLDDDTDNFFTTVEGADPPTMALPMKLIDVKEGGRTDVGTQREHNEDTFYIESSLRKQEGPKEISIDARGLYILCDGMGGHAGGEVASAIAIETLKTYFAEHWPGPGLPSADCIREGIWQANQAIYEVNERDERFGNSRMGTTLVLLLLNNTDAIVAHVGDSRLYRLSRRLGLQQVTTDHEVGQREIQRGVDAAIAYNRPDAYQLTQALGPRENANVQPNIDYLDLTEDALLILCSDGLSDNDLLETHWRSHLDPILRSRIDFDEGIAQLMELANKHNGHDNITTILVRVKVRPQMERLRL